MEPPSLLLSELELAEPELDELELEELELEELELEELDLLPVGEISSVFTDDLLELGVILIEDLVAGALSALLVEGGGGVGVGGGADFDTEAEADAGGGGGGLLLDSSFLVLSQPLTTTPSKTTRAKRRQRERVEIVETGMADSKRRGKLLRSRQIRVKSVTEKRTWRLCSDFSAHRSTPTELGTSTCKTMPT